MEKLVYVDRRNTNCNKWDGQQKMFGEEGLHAMWVADMDFRVPECVVSALREYVESGVYGYYKIPDAYYQAFIDWEREHHGYEVKKEWIRFIPGVVPAIYWLIQMWTQKEESVLIMPPVYYPFFNSIKETGRQLVECPLLKEDEHYKMDIELFENKILTENVKVFILCSPHNPVGRVWTKKELQAVLDICKKYGVYVIADEIHQDIIMSGYEKVTAATCGNYDEYLITLTSASKSFNIAGFQCAYAIIPNAKMREDYDRLAKKLHFTEGNSFSYIATQAVYEHGRPWLESVCNIVESNYYYLKNELKKVMPKVKIAPLEGTYLAWLDMSDYEIPKRMKEAILDKCHLAVDFGELFGGEEYKSHIRLNLATSRENIEEVVKRLQLIK